MKIGASKVIELWDKYKMYDCIREHSIRVSALSLVIAKILIKKGEKIDLNLVKYGALLHDIAKVNSLEKEGHDSHNILGKEILTKEGFPELGLISEEHYLHYVTDIEHSNREAFIVNFADKLVNPEGYVTLKERFDRFNSHYPRYKDVFDKSYPVMERLFFEVFSDIEEYKKISKDLKEQFDFEKAVGMIDENNWKSIDEKKSVEYKKMITKLDRI